MADSEKDDRTEAPTGKRLEQAREEGNIAQSRELHMLSGLGFATIALVMTLPSGVENFVKDMKGLMEHAGTITLDSGTFPEIFHIALHQIIALGVPLIAATAIGGTASALLQSGFLIRPTALIPNFGRLNPISGITRFFSISIVVETIKSLAKLGFFGFMLYGVTRDVLVVVPHAADWTPALFTQQLYSWCMRVITTTLVVQAAIVVLDEAWVRYHLTQELRMSRQDIRDETRQMDGDPQVKGRLRQLRARRNRKRIRDAVNKATVVIINPTHYAVALVYENGTNGAPRIVAKGMDDMAARIREFAHEAKVPIVSNPPLARSLYTLPEDTEIPFEYFQAVAAVIAYVWKLKRPRRGGPAPVR